MGISKQALAESFEGFVEAVGTLTVFSSYRSAQPSATAKAFIFLSYPIIGFFFGVFAMCIVALAQLKIPMLVAWAVPSVWLLLSRATHSIDLAKTFNGLLGRGTNSERRDLFVQDPAGICGVLGAVAVFVGKSFALLQAARMDSHSLSLVVLLAPVFSRFIAVILGLNSDQLFLRNSSRAPLPKVKVLLGASLTVLLVGTASAPLSLIYLIVGLVTAVALRIAIHRRTVGEGRPMFGALIELSELAMLWVAVSLFATGMNPAALTVSL